MAHDQLEEEAQTTLPRRVGGGGGRLVVAGVMSACALGVSFGLWARPSAAERGDAPAPPKPEVEAELANRKLQIVLDDSPAPIGPLLDVMPADTGHPFGEAAAPEVMAPQGPPAGLMKVDAVTAPVAAMPAVIPAVAPPKPAPEAPKPAAAKVPKLKPEKKAELKGSKAETPRKPAETKVAKAEKPEPKTAKAAAAKKNRDRKVAKAEPKTKKADRVEPKKLAKLVKSVKAAPKTIKAKAVVAERKAKRELELAEAKRAEKAKKAKAERLAKAERVKAEKAKAQKLADARARKTAAKPKPQVEKASGPKKKVTPRGEGPMRVARNDPKPAGCASADPGEALVCADPRLNQRDRQLQRAFRNAEAAGVPASALQRQQQRWRQARAAAARDGSWAVEDVYEARIAELNDLARDARDF